MRLCLNPLENRNQEPLDSLPDSGIFRLPISGDVQSFDLRILTQPLNDVRRKDDVTRRDQHQGLRQSSQTSSVVLAPECRWCRTTMFRPTPERYERFELRNSPSASLWRRADAPVSRSGA